jgi:alpha-tubulin suppressor-like RCC1 family protein
MSARTNPRGAAGVAAVLLLLGVAGLVASCLSRDLPMQPRVSRPEFEIQDGAHTAGNGHFFFLSPMVPQPRFSGTFDGSLSPVVEICQWTGSACALLVARFTTTTGPGSETVRLDAADELYVANWRTDRFHLDPAKTYRIRVLVTGAELGHADVDVVVKSTELKTVNAAAYVPLLNGTTLAVKFRIEQGAVFVVGPAGGTVSAFGGLVTLAFPPGALAALTGITILPATNYPTPLNLVPGTVYQLGPDGTVFSEPVQLTIEYDPAQLPPGASAPLLGIHKLINGAWVRVPGSIVDLVHETVTAPLQGFSGYGLVESLSFTSVSAGARHTCGLTTKPDQLYCWGSNLYGQVGTGTTTEAEVTPVATRGVFVSGVFVSVSAGGAHTCGLTSAELAYCWGQNIAGQLGRGTMTYQELGPDRVADLTFLFVRAGGATTCGLAEAGEFTFHLAPWCWGDNSSGQLGDGTTINRSLPMFVLIGPFASMDVSVGHTCGLTAAGAAYCWGLNEFGELGDGTTTNRFTPEPVAMPPGVTFASVTTGTYHTCGVTLAGNALCWGRNDSGQLGDGTTTDQLTPVSVTGGLEFSTITAGAFYTCGLTRDGGVWCWGDNSSGQLGDGTTTDRLNPVAVPDLIFGSVDAGDAHTCGVTLKAGGALCWGANESGQLGDGTQTTRLSPVSVLP